MRCARVLAKVRPETRRACRLVCCRWNFRLNVLAANWEDSCPCPVKSAGLKSLASNLMGPGPFQWAVDLSFKGDSVRIDATKPPPAAE